MAIQQIIRSLVFPIPEGTLPNPLVYLLKDFRLIVNICIRTAIDSNTTSRGKLTKLVYKDLSKLFDINKQYICSAVEIACGIVKNYRKRLRKGLPTNKPFVKRLMLKSENQNYNLDMEFDRVSLPVRVGEWYGLKIPISDYHRGLLKEPGMELGSLTLTPTMVIITVRKIAPAPFTPTSAIALDTNECSLDGVRTDEHGMRLVSIAFEDIRRIQETHYQRRRKMQKKKSHDRRVMKRLLSKEGKREHDRVEQRLHKMTKKLVQYAERERSAIILEDLTGISRFFSSKLNRRLSSWPHRELHRQVDYKALPKAVPVIKTDPRYSSSKCAACGRIEYDAKARKSTIKSGIFRCPACGWKIGRHYNSGLNILQTALAETPMLGALRFRLDDIPGDVMNPLYEPCGAARDERMGM